MYCWIIYYRIVDYGPISGGPGHEPTFADWRLSVDLIRNIHFLLGFIFTASFTLRIYGWIINRGDRLLPKFWTTKYMEETVEVALHYSLLKYSHKPYLRNPFGSWLIFSIIYYGFSRNRNRFCYVLYA